MVTFGCGSIWWGGTVVGVVGGQVALPSFDLRALRISPACLLLSRAVGNRYICGNL